MKNKVILLATLALSACNQAPDRGQAFCSTPLGAAKSNDYHVSLEGTSTRIIMNDVVPGSTVDSDISLCVFLRESK